MRSQRKKGMREQGWLQNAMVLLKSLIAVWALSGDSLSLLLSGYVSEVPVLKYVFTVLGAMDGWGIETFFFALGIGVIFYLTRDRQKNPWVSVISAFFALGTIVGISYEKTGSWDCLFLFGLQFVLAVFVFLGYFFLYKNAILFLGYVLERKPNLLRGEPAGKLEQLVFETHPFLGPFCFVLLFGLPWLIAFFPGTLQWDAHAQLWMYFGAVEKTGHFPVAITQLMGACVQVGRTLFHSDSMGLFLYTFPQFLLQSAAFAYACYVMHKLQAPVLLRWLGLVVWAVLPYFPIWGYTMVKDTPHYAFFLLMVAVFVEMLHQGEERPLWRQRILFVVSALGVAMFRNDGRYVVYLTLLYAVIAYRRHWKLFLAAFAVCVLSIFAVEGIYMPSQQIADGPIGEMLSIPLQQTARYLRDHYDEVTEEERAVLQEGFTVELSQVAAGYTGVCSDGIKSNFVRHPDGDYLKAYFQVWFQQLCKHPDTYVQAALQHVYGYFYPDRHNYGDYLGFFYLGNSQHWEDGYLDMQFMDGLYQMRMALEQCLLLLEKTPVLSLFLSAGFHTYVLFGCIFLLLSRKKYRMLIPMVPAVVVLLICMVSPVNAFLRYCMPIMAAMPVYLAWSCHLFIGEPKMNTANTTNTIETRKIGKTDDEQDK